MTNTYPTLEHRIAALEDRFAIEDVRHRYCYAIDERDWETLESLFTADASLDYGGLGSFEGTDGVREFAEHVVESQLTATAHAVHNPLVSVDGDTATGQWYVTSPVTFTDGTGGFRWGRYDEQYRRIDGEWHIATLRLRFLYALDYDDGWPDWQTFSSG